MSKVSKKDKSSSDEAPLEEVVAAPSFPQMLVPLMQTVKSDSRIKQVVITEGGDAHVHLIEVYTLNSPAS